MPSIIRFRLGGLPTIRVLILAPTKGLYEVLGGKADDVASSIISSHGSIMKHHLGSEREYLC